MDAFAVAWAKLQLWREYTRCVLPCVRRELEAWRRRARQIPQPALRRHALLSLELKAFHCEGGAALALAAPGRVAELVRFIVAFQTLSDVLDSWTDRAGLWRAREARALHGAMLAAVSPGLGSGWAAYADPHAHEASYGDGLAAGGEYLAALVSSCREVLGRLPAYGRVCGPVRRLVERYVELQVIKHRHGSARERALAAWHRCHAGEAPGLHWWEFAAACGSTVPVFALVALAAGGPGATSSLADVLAAYVPWVAALHILLDYLIDREEDRSGRDVSLVEPYGSPERALQRLAWIARQAAARVRAIPGAPVHELVLQGLPALYLSDPKARGLRREAPAGWHALMREAGVAGRLLWYAMRWQRLAEPLRLQPPAESVDEHAFAMRD